MDNKNRLYEVFSKVNKVKLNEQLDVDPAEEARDNLRLEVKEEIKTDFKRNPKMFQSGILHNIGLNISGEEVNLKLVEAEDNIELVRESGDQLEYSVKYQATIKGLPFSINIPLNVDVEMVNKGDKTDLELRQWIIPEEIEVEFSEF